MRPLSLAPEVVTATTTVPWWGLQLTAGLSGDPLTIRGLGSVSEPPTGPSPKEKLCLADRRWRSTVVAGIQIHDAGYYVLVSLPIAIYPACVGLADTVQWCSNPIPIVELLRRQDVDLPT